MKTRLITPLLLLLALTACGPKGPGRGDLNAGPQTPQQEDDSRPQDRDSRHRNGTLSRDQLSRLAEKFRVPVEATNSNARALLSAARVAIELREVTNEVTSDELIYRIYTLFFDFDGNPRDEADIDAAIASLNEMN